MNIMTVLNKMLMFIMILVKQKQTCNTAVLTYNYLFVLIKPFNLVKSYQINNVE